MARLDEKRRAILDAARPVFLRDGWSGATLDRVAAESGISKMTVYRHFRTKEQLFEALVTAMCRDMARAAFGGDPPAGLAPGPFLEAFAWDVVRQLTQPDALALYRVVIADGWRFPALSRLFEQSGTAILRQRVRDVLVETGQTQEDASARASGFINLFLGDAYLEAALGFDDPERTRKFGAQIRVAVEFALAPQKQRRVSGGTAHAG